MPFLHRCLSFLTLAASSLTVLILLGRFHWFLERLTHFRLPFAIGLLVLLTLLLAAKHWKSSIALAICFFLQAVPLSHHYLPFAKDARLGSGPELKVLTFNVLTSNPQKEDALAFLTAQNADLLCLQEISIEWLAALQPLRNQYPHAVSYPRSDNFGLLLFSKHPISSHFIEPEKLGTPYLTAEIDWHGTALTLINVHPLPPISSDAATSRNATLARIHHDTRHSTNPVIIAGDFNCTPYSPAFTPLKKNLRDTARGRGYPATWHRGNPLLGIPIDHLLHTDELVCTSRHIGPQLGSDHSPLIATFRLLTR